MNNYVLCLKHGTKYSADYVNKLYNMACRHLSINFDFICMTEDPSNLNPSIRIIPLETETQINGWWYKPTIFNPDLGLNGTILFLDLDIVIFENIDKLFQYSPGSFCIIKDYYLKKRNKEGMNSSCFRFETGSNTHVYENFIKNSETIMKRLSGDQDWMQEIIKEDFVYWPEDWIMSYKWELHNEKQIIKTAPNTYKANCEPNIKDGSCIAVFHGVPKPHQLSDSWCTNHWR